MEIELFKLEDIELAELAEQEMEIIKHGIPDTYSVEVMEEVVRRFRDKLTM